MSQINKRGPGSSGSGPILTLTGNNPVAITPDGAGNINVVGDGVTAIVFGTLIDNTLTISVVQTGMTWETITTNGVHVLEVNKGYILDINVAGTAELFVPELCLPGDTVRIVTKNASAFRIIPNFDQTIQLGSETATDAGSTFWEAKDAIPQISFDRYSCVDLLCTNVDDYWVITNLEGSLDLKP